jgi:hypothetical protein
VVVPVLLSLLMSVVRSCLSIESPSTRYIIYVTLILIFFQIIACGVCYFFGLMVLILTALTGVALVFGHSYIFCCILSIIYHGQTLIVGS